MNSKLSLSVKLAALALLGISASSHAAVKLQQVKVNPLLTEQLVIELDFDGAVSQYTDRLKYQPNQLLLHVPQSQSALQMSQVPVERHGVEQLVVQPSGDGLDISVDLKRLMPYQIQQDGDRLLVTLGQAPVAAQAAAVVVPQSQVAATTAVSKPAQPHAAPLAQGG